MSNHWYCDTCDSQNHDDRSSCWKCFPEGDELRDEIDNLRAELEEARKLLLEAKGPEWTAEEWMRWFHMQPPQIRADLLNEIEQLGEDEK